MVCTETLSPHRKSRAPDFVPIKFDRLRLISTDFHWFRLQKMANTHITIHSSYIFFDAPNADGCTLKILEDVRVWSVNFTPASVAQVLLTSLKFRLWRSILESILKPLFAPELWLLLAKILSQSRWSSRQWATAFRRTSFFMMFYSSSSRYLLPAVWLPANSGELIETNLVNLKTSS